MWTPERNSPLAIQLEEFWNRLLRSGRFQNSSAVIRSNIFSDEFNHSDVDAVICAHTHVVPTGERGDIEDAVTRAFGPLATGAASDLECFIQPSRHPNTRNFLSSRSSYFRFAAEPARTKQHDIIGTAGLLLPQSERRFRALIENSSDAISLLDPKGDIIYTSASTSRVLRYQPRMVIWWGATLTQNGVSP